MKRMRRNRNGFYLPEEIIRNILKRLPVKTLIRFQCVCKDWKNLIKNPSFIADHLQQQSSHQNFSLLLENYLPWHSRLLFREFPKAPLINSLPRAIIVSSCNGLLCVESGDEFEYPPSLILWNPATTAVRHVPLTQTGCSEFLDECVIGFGFSPIVDDYVIVRFWHGFYDLVYLVEVFSFSRGSWKEIDTGNLLEGVRLGHETVTANGAIFWYGEKRGVGVEPRAKLIVSFDIAKEMFTLIPMPDLGHISNIKLTVYDNKLAILCDIWEVDDETHCSFDLWVLDECTCPSGERWSWTKRSTKSPLSCKLESRIVWRNEIVCQPKYEDDEENALYTINLTTNEVKRFVMSCESHIYDIHNFVESLVPVDNNAIEESGS